MNKDILGANLYNAANAYNEVDIPPEQMEVKRLEFWIKVADEIIKHLKADAVIPGAGLVAPSGGGPVTGNAKIQ